MVHIIVVRDGAVRYIGETDSFFFPFFQVFGGHNFEFRYFWGFQKI